MPGQNVLKNIITKQIALCKEFGVLITLCTLIKTDIGTFSRDNSTFQEKCYLLSGVSAESDKRIDTDKDLMSH